MGEAGPWAGRPRHCTAGYRQGMVLPGSSITHRSLFFCADIFYFLSEGGGWLMLRYTAVIETGWHPRLLIKKLLFSLSFISTSAVLSSEYSTETLPIFNSVVTIHIISSSTIYDKWDHKKWTCIGIASWPETNTYHIKRLKEGLQLINTYRQNK